MNRLILTECSKKDWVKNDKYHVNKIKIKKTIAKIKKIL